MMRSGNPAVLAVSMSVPVWFVSPMKPERLLGDSQKGTEEASIVHVAVAMSLPSMPMSRLRVCVALAKSLLESRTTSCRR